MCVAATSKRRRRQSKNDYRHICAKQRPRYKKRDAATSARRLNRLIETERRMKQKAK
jgi:hypothetical protein